MGMVTVRALFWSNKPNPAIQIRHSDFSFGVGVGGELFGRAPYCIIIIDGAVV
jgi:hypothetical protein